MRPWGYVHVTVARVSFLTLGRPSDDPVTSLSRDVVPDADEPQPRVRTAFRLVGWAIAATPLLFVTVQLLHAVHLRLLLGRWPIVYRDNPEGFLLRVLSSTQGSSACPCGPR